MTGIRTHIVRAAGYIARHRIALLGAVIVALLALSFRSPAYGVLIRDAVTSTRNKVCRQQRIMERHIARALQEQPGSCLDIEDLPEEMVLYKYNVDTLHSWINRFPIVDDYSDSRPYSYRLNSLQDGFNRIAPLAYLKDEWQYVNLGRDWFLLCKRHAEYGNTKIIAGIRLQMEPAAGLCYTTLAENPFNVVRGIDGTPLFSISSDAIAVSDRTNLVFKWAAFFLTLLILILYHKRKRTWGSFFVSATGLALLRMSVVLSHRSHAISGSIFSPSIYADNAFFPSFGDFLLNNLFFSMLVLLLFYIREEIARKSKENGRQFLATTAAGLMTVTIAGYMFFALRSLILNSNIVLEPFRINDLSFYTGLSYLSFAMLVLALIFSLQFFFSLLSLKKDISIFSWREMMLSIAVISIAFVAGEGLYGLKKEYNRNRVATSRLAIERDMPMELALKSMEDMVMGDRFIAALTSVKGYDIIRNRLMDRYFNRLITTRYDISLSACGPNDYAGLSFYGNIIDTKGQPVEGSRFFTFINNYDGRTSYLGVFPYYDNASGEVNTLFVTFSSKYKGTPAIAYVPLESYACYSDGHLTVSSGSYNYSSAIPNGIEPGYSMVNKDGYVHFVNKLSDTSLTIISRRHHPLFTYLVSFSYLFIFFALFALICTLHYREERVFNLPRHSLKRKISFLIIGPMVVALASLAMAIIGYNVKVQEQRDRSYMSDKLNSVQSALAESCRYASCAEELCTPEFVEAMERVARISNVIINVYGVDGSLLCSTSSHPAGRRMHHHAYHDIVHSNFLHSICTEKIGGHSYSSTFSPLFNSSGEMVGIVNVPFNPERSNADEAVSSTVATIINLYIVLLIAAVLISVLLSNSILKPVQELRRKMDSVINSTVADRHIQYIDSKDEIGILVKSYNDMVDALDESSRRLARTEREAAWKEMARQIAHEIKNPLTPMRLSIQYLIRLKNQNADGWEEKVDTIGKSLLEQIDILAERASEFSSIAKSLAEPMGEVDIDELLGEQVTLFDNRDDISLVYDCREDKPVVQARRKQLARVFVNLITNSIQAIDNAGIGEGRIRITISGRTSEGRQWHRMDFEDNGPGVCRENLGKLFQPDFTTKSGGSGLGLSICRSIVEEIGGTITYAPSANLGGACFTIDLPA